MASVSLNHASLLSTKCLSLVRRVGDVDAWVALAEEDLAELADWLLPLCIDVEEDELVPCHVAPRQDICPLSTSAQPSELRDEPLIACSYLH